MSEDLPIRVAQRLREEDEALDPRLERLAMGALSPEALAELEADAARDPELARQVALFRPLSSELQDRLTEQMSAPVAKVIRPARWTRWGLPIVTLAAAALLLMTLRGPSALPSYAGRVEGGDVVLRGEPTPAAQGRRVMRGDSLLTLELSPATQVDGAVVARAYVRTPAGARAAPGVPEVDPSGAVRLRGVARELLGVASGTVSVALVVARPGALPEPDAAFAPSEGPRLEVQLLLR